MQLPFSPSTPLAAQIHESGLVHSAESLGLLVFVERGWMPTGILLGQSATESLRHGLRVAQCSPGSFARAARSSSPGCVRLISILFPELHG